MKLWLGFMAMLKKEIILMRRYFVNSIGAIITIYLIFMLMFWGYRGMAGAGIGLGEAIENLVVGYLVWLMLMMAYQTIPYTVLNEAQEGTLEQLYMCPLGFVTLGAFKFIASVLVDSVFVVAMLFLAMATTGTVLNLDVLSLLPLLVLAVAGVSGLGFFFGGVTLLFKRIQSYLQIVQYAMVALVAVPPTAVFRWLPAVLPTHWIRQIMVQGQDLSYVPAQDWLIMSSCALLSVTAGVAMFMVCETKARQKGILGHF